MIGNLIFYVKASRFILAWFVSVRSCRKATIMYECERWLKLNMIDRTGFCGFITLMMKFPEYRSLVYYRTGCSWLRHFGKGQTNLYFHTPSDRIGKGLVIWHGYSTVINASSIGEDCSIWHNVTIGKKSVLPIDDKPIIGNNVSICTGAIVVGDIIVSDNTTIGAGSVVVDSINRDAVVVGPKASIIKYLRK